MSDQLSMITQEEIEIFEYSCILKRLTLYLISSPQRTLQAQTASLMNNINHLRKKILSTDELLTNSSRKLKRWNTSKLMLSSNHYPDA